MPDIERSGVACTASLLPSSIIVMISFVHIPHHLCLPYIHFFIVLMKNGIDAFIRMLTTNSFSRWSLPVALLYDKQAWSYLRQYITGVTKTRNGKQNGMKRKTKTNQILANKTLIFYSDSERIAQFDITIYLWLFFLKSPCPFRAFVHVHLLVIRFLELNFSFSRIAIIRYNYLLLP